MPRTAYVKGTVLLLAALILAVEGYFVYRYYEQHYGGATVETGTGLQSNRGAAATEDAATSDDAERETRAVFVHNSTPDNIIRNSTYIDHPAANGNPGAILLVTQSWEPDDAPTNAHPIGVWYDTNRGGRWAVFNQDLAPMPEGAKFNVVVEKRDAEGASRAIVHRSDPANTTNEVTYIDHPAANGNPKAVLSVTQNWNPGGGAGLYNGHFVGTRYEPGEERWTIANQDLAPMPEGAAFNVSISDHGT